MLIEVTCNWCQMHSNTLRIVTSHARRLRTRMVGQYGPDLGGFCGEASFRLRRILEAVGYHPTTINGMVQFPNGCGGHWWLELHQRYIDITGDQFNRHLPKEDQIPKVLVRPISQCHLYSARIEDEGMRLDYYILDYYKGFQ